MLKGREVRLYPMPFCQDVLFVGFVGPLGIIDAVFLAEKVTIKSVSLTKVV